MSTLQVHEVCACGLRTGGRITCARGARARHENPCARRLRMLREDAVSCRRARVWCGAARRPKQCACAANGSRWSATKAAGQEPGVRGLPRGLRSLGRWPNRARCGTRRLATGIMVRSPGFGGRLVAAARAPEGGAGRTSRGPLG